MEDLISRQAAIDLLQEWADGYSYIEVETNLAIKEFKELPSAQQWIPCSERLPEEYGLYLCTVKKAVDRGLFAGFVEIQLYDPNTGIWYDADRRVTAWMPLPEPYQEEGD